VVSAAADATLETIVEESVPEHAAAVGSALLEELDAAIDAGEIDARGVRGSGLLVGLELKRGANRVAKHLALDHQILALPAGRTVLRLLPPLTIDETHVDRVVDALSDVTGGDRS
jgi:acetylornithine/LysW-gamma-L-lysine aminotransferase